MLIFNSSQLTVNRSKHLCMRLLGLVGVCFFMFSCAANGQTAATETSAMEQCRLTQTASIEGNFKVSLERAGATGFQWFVDLPKNAAVQVVEQGEESMQPGLAGGGVKQWWAMTMQKPVAGKQVVVDFYLYRTWEGKERSAKHCQVQVRVE